MWNNNQNSWMVPGQRMSAGTSSVREYSGELSRKRKDMNSDPSSNLYNGVTPGSWGTTRNGRHFFNTQINPSQTVVTQGTESCWRNTELYAIHAYQPAELLNVQHPSGNYQLCNISNLSPSVHSKGQSPLGMTFSSENPTSDGIHQEPARALSYNTGSGGHMELCQATLESYSRTRLEHSNYLTPSKLHQFLMDSVTHQPEVNKAMPYKSENERHQSTVEAYAVENCGLENCGMSRKPDPYSIPSESHCDCVRFGNDSNDGVSCALLNNSDREEGHTIMLRKSIPLEASSCPKYEGIENVTRSLDSVSKVSEEQISEKKDLDFSVVEGTRTVELDHGPPYKLDKQVESVAELRSVVSEQLWEGLLQLNTSTTVSVIAFFKSGQKIQDIKWPKQVEIKGKVRLQAFEKFIQELRRSRNRALMVISLCWKLGSSKAAMTGMKEVAKGYRENERVGFAQISSGFDLYVCPRSDTIITILAKCGFFKGIMAVDEDPDSLIGCVVWRRNHQASNSDTKSGIRKSSSSDHPLLSPESSSAELKSVLTHGSEHKQGTPCSKDCPDETRSVLPEATHNTSLPPCASSFVPVRPPSGDTSYSKTSDIAGIRKPVSMASSSTFLSQPAQMVEEVLLRSFHSINGSHYATSSSDPLRQLTPPVSVDSLVAPLQAAHKLDGTSGTEANSSSSNMMLPIIRTAETKSSVPGFGEKQVALPGPPPLPPALLQRLIQSRIPTEKEPFEGVFKFENSVEHVAEPKTSSVRTDYGGSTHNGPLFLSQASHGSHGPYDDDLPEFDFRSACGFEVDQPSAYPCPDVPSFNKQLPAEKVSNARPPEAPSTTTNVPFQPITSFTEAQSLVTVDGISLASTFRNMSSESMPASQRSSLKIDKDSVSTISDSSIHRQIFWDDDDDDMPEWCPPEMEHADQHSPILPPNSKPLPEIAAPPPGFPLPQRSFSSLEEQDTHSQRGILGPRPAGNFDAKPEQTGAARFARSSPRPFMLHQRNHPSGHETSRPAMRSRSPGPRQDRWRSRRH